MTKTVRRCYSNFRGDARCDPECSDSNLKDKVDRENFLKTFAFYAVTMNVDSPLVNGNNYYLAQSGGAQGGWKIVPYDFNAARAVFCHSDVCNSRLVHWSIARPTCESLESNKIAGPILTDPVLHDQYIAYVREFLDTIYANSTFIQELEDHALAQRSDVVKDFWSVLGAFYSKELSPDAANWEEEGENFPLLPTMKARAEDVRAQLAAMDEDNYPRRGMEDYQAWEYCSDWRLEQANSSMCEEGCQYEGCHVPGWTVESFCDEEFGICYHGNYDEQCRFVADGDRYAGMEDTEDGRKTFCRYAAGIPVKAAECPAVGAVKSAAAGGISSPGGVTVLSVALIATYFVAFLEN